MTDCQATRDWILEVDPDELEQGGTGQRQDGTGGQQDGTGDQQDGTDGQHDGDGEHADHLARWPECRALADVILGAEAALRASLDSVEPALDLATALERAREAHQAGEIHRATSRRRRWQVALPLAAAALGGLLLLGRPSSVSEPRFDPATVRAARALGLVGPRPVVRAGSDERVAVIPTENPNITVIWFME